MDIIASKIELFDEILKIYEDVDFQNTFKATMNLLEMTFKKLLKDKGADFGIISSNSVYKHNHFYLETRLKTPESLKEKFIRKNLGLLLTRDLALYQLEDIREKKTEIEKYFKQIDDIVGIKIVADLDRDCNKIFNLITDNLAYLKDAGIVFTDISVQPVKMKNGLDIYNIKGKLNTLWSFELQIKSKINSAWADLEHVMFYKDYTVSPIRDTIKVAMNSVCKILLELEEYLYELRNSNTDYTAKAKYIEFLTRISTEIGIQLRTKLGYDYDLAPLAPILNHFISTMPQNKIVDPIECLTFEVVRNTAEDALIKQYLYIRQSDFALLLLETIYLNWVMAYREIEITDANYEGEIRVLLSTIKAYLAKETKVKYPQNEDIELIIDRIFDLGLTYGEDSSVIFKESKYVKGLNFFNLVESYIIDEDIGEPEVLRVAADYYYIYIFSGNIRKYFQLTNQTVDSGKVMFMLMEMKRRVEQMNDRELISITSAIMEIIESGGAQNEQ